MATGLSEAKLGLGLGLGLGLVVSLARLRARARARVKVRARVRVTSRCIYSQTWTVNGGIGGAVARALEHGLNGFW